MAKRKKFSPQTEAEILKKHLQKKEAMSDLCTQYECTPGSVYQWQDLLFSRAHQCFENKTGRPVDEKLHQANQKALQEKLAMKNAVIAELMEELLKKKAKWGNLSNKWVAPELRDEIVAELKKVADKDWAAIA